MGSLNNVSHPLLSSWFYIPHTSSGGSRIFPRGGGVNPPGGREHAKFSRKLHEIERIWTPRGGRASLTPPPRSANDENQMMVR